MENGRFATAGMYEGWQAEVQEIQSGERWNFSSREGLRAFLQWLIEDYEREGRDRE